MATVGVRELKRDLSGYLRRAAAGEHIRVTVRGEPAVDLVPAVEAPELDADQLEEEQYAAELDRLVKAGKITLPTRPKTKEVVWDIDLGYSPLQRILEEREADVWPRRPYPEDEPS